MTEGKGVYKNSTFGETSHCIGSDVSVVTSLPHGT